MPVLGDGSDRQRRVVLLIDEDPKVGRLVRLSLHGPDCQVLATSRFLEGLRMAARFRPHLILMEVRFDKADGLALAEKLLQAPETKAARLAFLTADTSAARLIRAIQLGAQDYILKPVEGKVLSSRVEAIFTRISDGDALEQPVAGPAAERLLELVQQVETDASTGVLKLARGGQTAQIAFSMGKLQGAELGPLREDQALAAIARHADWEVIFSEGERLPAALLARQSTAPQLVTRIDTDSDLSSTQPRLPAMFSPQATEDDFQPATISEAPIRAVKRPPTARTGRPRPGPGQLGLAPGPGLAPEPGLGAPVEEEIDDRTIVDPDANPLLHLDLATRPAAPAPPRPVEHMITVSTPRDDSPIDLSSTEEFYDDDVLTPLQFKIEDDSVPSVTLRRPVVLPVRGDPTLPEPGSAAPTLSAAGSARQADQVREQSAACGLPAALVPSPAMPRPSGTPPGTASMGSLLPAGSTPSEGTPSPPEPPDPPALRRWLAAIDQAPLILIIPNDEVRVALQQVAQAAGFTVQCVASGLEAYTAAQQRRPLAFLSDVRISDMEGREFLWAIRLDFLVRETPFLMVSGAELLPKVAAVREAAAAPILRGLECAVAPAVNFHERLINAGEREITGRVEPVGLATLLRTIGGAGVTGSLQLRRGEERNAEVVLHNGEICGATVNAPQSSVGPMAMLHLLGYEWSEYRFTRGRVNAEQVPLGDLSWLVDTACKQNNILLARVYRQGTQIEDVSIDRSALDLYLQGLQPESLELLIRLVEGDSAAGLVELGVAPQGILRSMLYELRRKAVIRPTSLRPVRMEADLIPAGQVAPAAAASPSARRRRWLVAVIAGLSTVALAAAGYLIYVRLGL